jgi:uroporphyrinogen III methyltransferase/synthase
MKAARGTTGIVTLVGAGPGAIELLTLGAKQAIEQAEVILYDGLVNDQILSLAPAACKLICVGKRGHGGAWTQPQIDDLIVRCAHEFHRVVRLKGGDTAVFARTSEEIDRLRDEGIAYRVIPGLTAALAVSAYTGIPLTHRDWSSGVALLTAQLQASDGESEAEDQLDWDVLARFPGTLVMYMSVGSAAVWSQKLLAAGKPASTPVALVRKCSWPDQEVIECELDQIPQTLAANPGFAPPVISIIGPVVRLKSPTVFREPLHPATVIVTSPEPQSQRLAGMLESLGFSAIIRPAIEIQAADTQKIDLAMDSIKQTDWLVFSSRYGVHYFFEHLLNRGFDARYFGPIQIATVGRSTAQTLRDYGLIADCIAGGAQGAEALVEQWISQARDKRVLLVGTPEGKQTLAHRLSGIASDVQTVHVYQQVPVLKWDDMDRLGATIEKACKSDQKVWVTATSSNIAQAAWALLGPKSHSVRWAAISEPVALTLKKLGARQVIQASEASYESLCEAMCEGKG